jgi:parvulin-like peptidyl-prolyl isomerase
LAKKKKKTEKPQREFTKRQLSQWQRQKRRQRIIFSGGIFIIAAIILIVLVGWYISEYRPLHQTAIRVNDTEFEMGYYIDALKIGGREQSVEYVQSLADNMIREIEQIELMRQGALQLGISVSDDEVKDKLEGSDIPISDASLDLVRGQMLRERLYNEYFKSQVPVSAEQVHIMAMLLESESQAAEIRTRLQNSENFTALAEEYSLDYYTKNNKGDLGWHPEIILAELLGSSVPGEYAFGSEAGVLSQPRYDKEISKEVGYWLVRVQEREGDETEALVQAILLGSEEEAQDVRARLEAGEDLATLAEELSQFEESQKQGGELGVVSEGDTSPAVDGYIFNPETKVGTWSEPIHDETAVTKGGYWLINVLDRDDDRQLEGDDRDFLMTKALNEWVVLLWVNAGDNVDDSYLDYEKKAWAIERVMKG